MNILMQPLITKWPYPLETLELMKIEEESSFDSFQAQSNHPPFTII